MSFHSTSELEYRYLEFTAEVERERTHQHMTWRSKSIDNTLIVFRLEGSFVLQFEAFLQILPKTVGILISIPATRLERVSNTNVRDTKLLSYYPSISFLRSIEYLINGLP